MYAKYMKGNEGEERLSFSEFRKEMAEYLDRVKYRGERIVIHRRGRDVAALISLEDLALLAGKGTRTRTDGSGSKRPGRSKPLPRPAEGLGLGDLRSELGL